MRKELQIGRNIGALLGLIVFAIWGIMPGFYFGSFGTLTLLSHLAGTGLEPSVVVRMMLVIGTLLGIFCIGAVSLVVGSVIGTALGAIASLFTKDEAKQIELA